MIYSFNKASNPDRLSKEIQSSSITVALDKITSENTLSIYFKASLSTSEESTLSAIVEAHDSSPSNPEKFTVSLDSPKTSTGLPKMAMHEPEGGAATVVSHNFADKCSWYHGSVKVLNGSLTTGDSLNFFDPNSKTHWIDLENGRVYNEDNIMSKCGSVYKVEIFVDGVAASPTSYSVDYPLGKVTFTTPQVGAVTANYHYADKSWYRLRPEAGKILSIKAAEVQFSRSTNIPSPFVFEPWFVDHPIYGTMPIPGQQIAYKNAKDFISACNEGQGVIPAWGELTEDVHVFPMDYARPKPVRYSENIEIRVYCKSHEKVIGEFATATFYVTIDDEA